LRDGIDKLKVRNVEVVGISFDSPKANRDFVEKHQFPFKLLSDPTKDVAIAYGAASGKNTLYPSRQSFVVDEKGNLLFIFRDVSPSTHLDEVLKALGPPNSAAGKD
jgi:peroxiredoxin Q/BCP